MITEGATCMDRFLLSTILILVTNLSVLAQQKVSDGTSGDGGSMPNRDAILELESSKRGLLNTRVALVRTIDASPLSQHVAGMMVYNTSSINDVHPGIYYNDGSKWILAAGTSASQQIMAFEIDETTHILTLSLESGGTKTVNLAPYVQIAGDISYAKGAGDLKASTVQGAIDELARRRDNVNAIKEVNVSYYATKEDNILLGNASDGTITISLPAAAGNKGKKYTIKKQDSNEDTYVNVQGAIEGDITLYTALPYTGWDLMSDGIQWKIVNKF